LHDFVDAILSDGNCRAERSSLSMYIQDSYSIQSTFTSTRLGLLRFIALQRLVTLVTLDTYNSTIFARAYSTISGKCRPLRSYINPNLLIKNVNLRFLKSKVTPCIVHKLGVCETLSNGCSHKLELVRCMISQVGRRRGSPVHGVGYQPVFNRIKYPYEMSSTQVFYTKSTIAEERCLRTLSLIHAPVQCPFLGFFVALRYFD